MTVNLNVFRVFFLIVAVVLLAVAGVIILMDHSKTYVWMALVAFGAASGFFAEAIP